MIQYTIEESVQLKNPSKVDLIYDSIEGRILKGEWKIGGQIPTEAELANEFGCSRGTVSKAIAQLVHDGLVERRTRSGTRVLERKGNRRVDYVALDACAFIFPSEQHEAIHRIAQGFQKAAHELKRRVVTLTTGTDFRKEAEIVGRLAEFDVKGAVVYPVLPAPKDRLYFAQMLMACSFPIVLVDIVLPGFGAPSVVIDGFHGGYVMTKHLLAQGLEKIGFLSNYSWVPSFNERFRGYCWALEEAGIERKPEWTLLEESMRPNFQNPVEESHSLTLEFLKRRKGLEGVVCCDDFLAASCQESARRLGLKIPDDLKIAGISDYGFAERCGLTTYHIDYDEIGSNSFRILNSLLQGEPISCNEKLVRGEIVVRTSA